MVSSCVISGKLGNLSELQLLSYSFLECMKDKLIQFTFQRYHVVPLAQCLAWSIQGVIAIGTVAKAESEDPEMS